MRHVTAGRVVRRAPLPRLGLRFDGMQRRSLPLPLLAAPAPCSFRSLSLPLPAASARRPPPAGKRLFQQVLRLRTPAVFARSGRDTQRGA